MDITITLTDGDQIRVLQSVASQNNKTIEAYASGIIKTWIDNHIRQLYIGYSQTGKLADLKTDIGDYQTVQSKITKVRAK